MNWLKLYRLALVPVAAFAIALIRLLRLPVRFGTIWGSRLGHMAGNMECYLCEREAGLSNGWDFFYYHGEPFNTQLDKMLRRVVRVDRTQFVYVCNVVNQLFEGWQAHRIDTLQVDRDINNLFEQQPAHLSFTAKEEARGAAGLRALGIPKGAKWVYLIVRDSAKHPHLPYHSYRNTDIDTYEQAALALAERGYYVIRMGAKVAKPLKVNHPRVIDYASRGQDDFMAVYLGAHCAFCLSSGTGPDAIPVIFRRPVCYVNYVPLEYLQTYHKGSLAIWKHHMKDGKRMTLAEIYESKAGHFMAAEDFEAAGITLVDNTPEEIKAAALEMADRIEDKRACNKKNGPEAFRRQEEFWAKFPRGVSAFNNGPLHGRINMRIGAEFLKGYQ